MNAGDVLGSLLVQYGVRYVFGIPGGQTAPLYRFIGRSGGAIQHIHIRDERSGPYMADAYARVTGRLAVCDAVPGPGVVKFPSGLYEAYATSIPLIAVAGDIPRDWARLAPFACAAQGLDQPTLLRSVCKAVLPVTSGATMAAQVERAFAIATTGRAGPVVLNIPSDVMREEVDAAIPIAADTRYAGFPAVRVRPPAQDVEAAVRVLVQARRPVMVVGGGGLASRALDEVRTLAELLVMPVATSVSGKGVIAEDHPLAVGVLGGQYGEESANAVVREADVVFLVGLKSSQQSTFSWTLPTPAQRVVHLDVDPYEIGKVFATEVGLVGDAAAGLQDLHARIAELQPRAPDRSSWLEYVGQARRAWETDVASEAQPRTPIEPAYLLRELQRQTSADDIFVSDASFSVGWITSFYDVRKAGRRCIFPRGSATLGFGLPAAIGASLASPASRVVCVAGDGGITYAIGELSTCRKYNLPVTLVVLNNGCLGYSKWGERHGDRRYENVDFPPTDFATIARGFGCAGIRVERLDELGDAIAQGLRADGPVVLDVVVDEWAAPELRLRQERAALHKGQPAPSGPAALAAG
ncbi:MAG: thiamine pyrophosphate-binding protein [Chloroflexi bacterium]|nr:thiamine pyrophosphate-binding protein [Chloroflexota bacterium]